MPFFAFLFFIVGSLVAANIAIHPTPSRLGAQLPAIPTAVASPSPTEIPTPTRYQQPAPTVDPDPPVLCNVSPKCGGGTTPLKQSECNNSTCCGFSDGRWVFYKDKNQCTKDQNALMGGSVGDTSQKVMLNVDDYGGLTKGTFYCYSDKVNELSNLQNQIRIDDSIATSCTSIAQLNSNSCTSKCSGNADFASCDTQCIDAYYASCKDSSTKVGDERKQLYTMVHNDCP